MRSEHRREILGVDGQAFASHKWPTRDTFSSQTWGSTRYYDEDGQKYRISVTLRFDDNCKNSHNDFSAVADIRIALRGIWAEYMGGCCHEEIARQFPELAPLLKWHLTSTDGPMHYLANTVYMAGNRDHWGLLKGERRQLKNRDGVLAWKRTEVTLPQYVDADACPPATQTVGYEAWCQVGEGKERELAHARAAAVWLDATDEELTAPGLAERLKERLPALLAEFKIAMVDVCGFEWAAIE